MEPYPIPTRRSKVELYSQINSGELNKKSRRAIAKMLEESPNKYPELRDKEVFRMVDDSRISLEEIQTSDDIAFSHSEDITADKVVQEGKIVIDEDDSAGGVLATTSTIERPDEFDIDKVGNELGVNDGHNITNDAELGTWEYRRVNVARELAEKIGFSYDIVWGDDPKSEAWTDGDSFIAITEDVFESSQEAAWLPKLYHTLCHEAAHDEDSKGGSMHNESFKAQVTEYIEKKEGEYAEFVANFDDRGISDFEPDAMTKMEKNRCENIYKEMNSLEEGDVFYKNGDDRASTILTITSSHVEFQGPGGGQWKISTIDESTFPIATKKNSDSTQKIVKIDS